MIKRLLFGLAATVMVFSAEAQRKDFTYKFYGFVRGDACYNSRNNAEGFDGHFNLYPLNEKLDADGKDLNANPSTNYSIFTTRFGLDAGGPNIGSAKTTAKVEADFGGASPSNYTLRIRHIYVKFDWEKGSSVLLGQTWHPLFGDVLPEMLNLATGSPFQPFNRSVQLRYQYRKQRLTFTTSAIYQQMYLSSGPNGKSTEYLKNGVIPELFAGINYQHEGFLAGAGVEMISLKPRTQSVFENKTYKVNERVTSFSYVAQAKYTKGDLYVGAKTLLASNLIHTNNLGGYGVSSIDPINGEQDYTPSRHSTSWVNVVYGSKWRGGIFAGYSKNLGTSDALVSKDKFYGTGVDIDQLVSGMAHLSYNLPHWKIGVEYSNITAWYGTTDLTSGKVKDAKAINGHRFAGVFMYLF